MDHGGGGGDFGAFWSFGGFLGLGSGVGFGVGSGVGVAVGSAIGAGVSAGGGGGVSVGVGLGVRAGLGVGVGLGARGGNDRAGLERVGEASAIDRPGFTLGTTGDAIAGAGLADGWTGV